MSTRPEWALERAAEIILIAGCHQMRPTEQMDRIAELLLQTAMEGGTAELKAANARIAQIIEVVPA